VTYAASTYEALKGADALIICTEWTKFREPDFERMQSLMQAPVIFDGRNLYNPAKLANLGFQYFHIDKKSRRVAGGRIRVPITKLQSNVSARWTWKDFKPGAGGRGIHAG
jgi:UDP-glucose 6-dehydrogenase